jgi:hypothetical protein
LKVTPTPGSVSGRRIDRVGDPLEGLVNLFDLSLVLAVGLLLAALSSAGVVGLISGPAGAGTPIPGEPSGGQTAQGQGTAVGTVYRLQDGTYVFSPSGGQRTGATGATGAAPGGATPGTGAQPQTGTGGAPTQGTGSQGTGSQGTGTQGTGSQGTGSQGTGTPGGGL